MIKEVYDATLGKQLIKQEIIRKARYKLREVEGAVVDFFARVEPVSENGKEGWWVEASVWVDKVEDCDEP